MNVNDIGKFFTDAGQTLVGILSHQQVTATVSVGPQGGNTSNRSATPPDSKVGNNMALYIGFALVLVFVALVAFKRH